MSLTHGFKKSPIGAIPTDWETRTIAEVFELINGCAFKPSDWKQNGTPIVRIQNLNDPDAPFNYFQGPVAERNKVESGDLLFAWSGTIGSSFGARIWPGPVGVLNQHIFKVLMDESKLAQSFALIAFSRVEEAIAREAHGFKASFVHVKKSDLQKIDLPVPPIEEQRAIATALSDVDTLIAGLERLIAKKRDIKQAAMQQLLTCQTRLPGFSGEWASRRLGDSVQFLKNGVHSRAELAETGDVKYLHYGDIHGAVSVFLNADHTAMPYLPLLKAAKLDRLQDGDLVFADASEDKDGIGKAVELRGIGEKEVVAGLHTIAARFDNEVLADGFKAYLPFMPPFSQHLKRLAAGTKVYATNRKHIASVELRLPGAAEQIAIATVLSDMDAGLSALEARLIKTRAIKQGMMQELLTGRTRLV